MKHEVTGLENLQATIQEIPNDKLLVVYLDVGQLPPSYVPEYVETVRKEFESVMAPRDVIWIPVRGEDGTRIESIPSGRNVFYVDVSTIPPNEVENFIQQIKKRYFGDDMPILPCRGGARSLEIIDESEMNERGWYYYGVKRDGTPVE